MQQVGERLKSAHMAIIVMEFIPELILSFVFIIICMRYNYIQLGPITVREPLSEAPILITLIVLIALVSMIFIVLYTSLNSLIKVSISSSTRSSSHLMRRRLPS